MLGEMNKVAILNLKFKINRISFDSVIIFERWRISDVIIFIDGILYILFPF